MKKNQDKVFTDGLFISHSRSDFLERYLQYSRRQRNPDFGIDQIVYVASDVNGPPENFYEPIERLSNCPKDLGVYFQIIYNVFKGSLKKAELMMTS